MKTASEQFTPAFQVFKEGTTTEGFITILRNINEPFDMCAKISKYIFWGYTVRGVIV